MFPTDHHSVENQRVLVTGATGYIGAHVVKKFLDLGFKVRGTVRSLKDKSKYEFLYNVSSGNSKNLELFEINLLDKKEQWEKATEGVDYVLHVASPASLENFNNDEEAVKPAVDGTLNVLNASLKNKVKKVVVTSSSITVTLGGTEGEVNEDNQLDVNLLNGYPKGKLLAERAALEFHQKHSSQIEVTVVNPSGVFGPGLTSHESSSNTIILGILRGDFLGVPNPDIGFAAVDVVDVAEAHVKALFNPKSSGKRFILSARTIFFSEIFGILADEFNKQGFNIATTPKSPEELRKNSTLVVEFLLGFSGNSLLLDNSRGIKELGFAYSDLKKSIIDMAYNFIRNGQVQKI